jgi:DNA primase catalytic core
MINKLSDEYFISQLFADRGRIALEYVHKRNYDDESIKTYGIGYAPGKDSLLTYLQSKANFTKEQLMESGLFVEKNGRITDKFNNRVMFSIRNERGKVVAFSGRIMPGNDYGPKYLNSPETPIFHKKNTLYGLYFAKNEIRAQDLCIVCEAQTEVITCHKVGLKHIVAPMGTALTEEHLDMISKYTKNIVLSFNSDTAGQAAIERGFIMCTKKGLNSYAANPGKYKDLDDLIQAEPDTLLKLFENKQDAFTYLLSRKIQNLDLTNFQHFNQTLQYVQKLISEVKDEAIKSFYLTKAEEITGIKKENLVKQAQTTNIKSSYYSQQDNNYYSENYSTNSNKLTSSDKNTNSAKDSTHFTLEEYLLYYILQFNLYNLVDKINTKILADEDIINSINIIKRLKAEKVKDEDIAKEMTKEVSKNGEDNKHFLLLQKILFEVPREETTKTEGELSTIVARLIEEADKRQLLQYRKELSILENNPNADEKELEELANKVTKLSLAFQKRKI